MNASFPTLSRLAAILTATAALTTALATGARAEAPALPAIQPAMMTMAQAVTLAEATQKGIAFDMKRAAVGRDVVYRIKLSTPDRGIVKVQVAAYGGRLEVNPQDRHDTPA